MVILPVLSATARWFREVKKAKALDCLSGGSLLVVEALPTNFFYGAASSFFYSSSSSGIGTTSPL
jgi:hypothetical protein